MCLWKKSNPGTDRRICTSTPHYNARHRRSDRVFYTTQTKIFDFSGDFEHNKNNIEGFALVFSIRVKYLTFWTRGANTNEGKGPLERRPWTLSFHLLCERNERICWGKGGRALVEGYIYLSPQRRVDIPPHAWSGRLPCWTPLYILNRARKTMNWQDSRFGRSSYVLGEPQDGKHAAIRCWVGEKNIRISCRPFWEEEMKEWISEWKEEDNDDLGSRGSYLSLIHPELQTWHSPTPHSIRETTMITLIPFSNTSRRT